MSNSFGKRPILPEGRWFRLAAFVLVGLVVVFYLAYFVLLVLGVAQ